MELNLCERFPALTPFSIRKEKAGEVFLLVRRLKEYNKNTNISKSNIIRRKAGDDWF